MALVCGYECGSDECCEPAGMSWDQFLLHVRAAFWWEAFLLRSAMRGSDVRTDRTIIGDWSTSR